MYMRVNPDDALDCSLYVDIRIAEEEPEEEPEVDPSSNHNIVLSPCFLLVVPLISLYLQRNPGQRIDRINSVDFYALVRVLSDSRFSL